MLVLVLDTATPAVTAALVRVRPVDAEIPADVDASARPAAVTLVASRVTVDARAHGELLGPQISAVLAEAGARPADLVAVVAGLGPGPFTGLRVGLVTAESIGQALGIPTYGVCSLDGIGAGGSELTLVATDARRKEIYWAVYDKGVRITEPSVNRPAELAVLLGAVDSESGPVARAVGDGARLYADLLGLPVADLPRYPDPLALAGVAADRVRAGAPSERLHPLYLRRPDAVEPGSPKPVRQ